MHRSRCCRLSGEAASLAGFLDNWTCTWQGTVLVPLTRSALWSLLWTHTSGILLSFMANFYFCLIARVQFLKVTPWMCLCMWVASPRSLLCCGQDSLIFLSPPFAGAVLRGPSWMGAVAWVGSALVSQNIEGLVK